MVTDCTLTESNFWLLLPFFQRLFRNECLSRVDRLRNASLRLHAVHPAWSAAQIASAADLQQWAKHFAHAWKRPRLVRDKNIRFEERCLLFLILRTSAGWLKFFTFLEARARGTDLRKRKKSHMLNNRKENEKLDRENTEPSGATVFSMCWKMRRTTTSEQHCSLQVFGSFSEKHGRKKALLKRV